MLLSCALRDTDFDQELLEYFIFHFVTQKEVTYTL